MKYDVVVIGAGPAGAISAMLLARAGFAVIVLEKAKHPRFHIGESILPRNFPLVQELGLGEALKRVPQVLKLGTEFGMGDDANTTRFRFEDALIPGSKTFNIERAPFDQMLVEQARLAGAEVREETAVQEVLKLRDGDVAVAIEGETIEGKYILDCSGHGAVIGRHLSLRRPIDDPRLHKVAYFEHFENVERLAGEQEGYPGIIMTREGWFWLIAINEKITSIGFVTQPDFAKSVGVPPNRLLHWAVARCPVVRDRMRNASGAETNQILADFSYTCRPYAGPGYFLVGDAACFLDPIFSTGVTLAMMAGKVVSEKMIGVLKGQIAPERARGEYIRYVDESTGIFWRLIRNYYRHSFRELFLNGTGPMRVHSAIISILAGQVFPKPPWCLRWRLWFFELCMHVNRFVPLVPRRKNFSLLESSAPAREAQTSVAYEGS